MKSRKNSRFSRKNYYYKITINLAEKAYESFVITKDSELSHERVALELLKDFIKQSWNSIFCW